MPEGGAVTLKRAVEPFYTTKPAGHGTGLGLSMVHGLAAQSGSELALTSVLGQGTTAILRLPMSHEAVETQVKGANEVTDVHQAVIILIVDDEDLVRSSTGACSRTSAVPSSKRTRVSRPSSIYTPTLEITDYAMPGMAGVQLAREIRKVRKGLPILMITGFADLVESEAEILPRLSKPFRQSELVSSVVQLLGAARA